MMIAADVLMPAMVLVLWTLFMLLWMGEGQVKAGSAAPQKLDSALTNDGSGLIGRTRQAEGRSCEKD